MAGVNSVLYAKELKLSFYFSVSAYFWRNHADEIRNVSCHRRFLPENLKQQLSSDVPTSWLRCVYQRHLPEHAQHDFPHAFSERPEQLVHLGGTVLFPALQILAHLGFARIVLLGVDHNYGRGRGTRKKSLKGKELEGMNFVGHQWLPEDKVHVDLHQMERGYGLARHWFEHNGRQIVNATEGTKLKTFDRVRLGSELKT